MESHGSIDANRVTALDHPSGRIPAVLPTITSEIPKSLFEQITQAPGTWFLLDSLFLLCINGYWIHKVVGLQMKVFVLQVLATNIGILFPMFAIIRHSENDLVMWLICQFFGSVLFSALLEYAWTSVFERKSLLSRAF